MFYARIICARCHRIIRFIAASEYPGAHARAAVCVSFRAAACTNVCVVSTAASAAVTSFRTLGSSVGHGTIASFTSVIASSDSVSAASAAFALAAFAFASAAFASAVFASAAFASAAFASAALASAALAFAAFASPASLTSARAAASASSVPVLCAGVTF